MKLAIVALVLVQTTGCAARSRMGEVVVTQVGAQPCFGLENTAATRHGQHQLWSIAVYQRSGSDQRPVWAFTLPPLAQAPLLTPPACVPYGETPAKATVKAAAAALQPGVVYLVSMSARGANPHDLTISYSGEFCLVPAAEQRPSVHQVQWDNKAGKWQRDVCDAK